MSRYLFFAIILCMVVACQPASPTPPPGPTINAFPTVTPGVMIRGELVQQERNQSLFSNPATAVALANQPTPTPDTTLCPAPDEVELPSTPPDTVRDGNNIMVEFLANGGSTLELVDTLRDEWDFIGDTGLVMMDRDLTGDLTPDVMVSYAIPDSGAALLIMGCLEGRYVAHYSELIDEPVAPELIFTGDVNLDQQLDITFAGRNCEDVLDDCRYQTYIVTWASDVGRFVSLLASQPIGDGLPELSDMDGDQVSEIIVRLRDDGNVDSGPLRTGVIVYDWDGRLYVPSIPQLDPPGYTIQIIHQADRYFFDGDVNTAVNLYETAISDEELDVWYNNDATVLEAYALYRILLVLAMTGADAEQIAAAFQRIEAAYVDTAPPIYANLSRILFDTYLETGDVRDACERILETLAEQPQAIDLLNRYGNRSPIYTVEDLCPF